ncbi:Branchpoint-bridging protein [Schizosaccharomyces pombe]
MLNSRSVGSTGSNNTPLGRRRFDEKPDSLPPLPDANGMSNGYRDSYKSNSRMDHRPDGYHDGRGRRAYRKHYWGHPTPIEEMLPSQMELETAVKSCMTMEQLELYSLNVRLEEITQKLRTGDVVPHHRERSPSPPPQYDNHGRRLNTREIRYKKKLEDERHRIIERAMKMVPGFRAPSDYRRPAKTQEKVYVPVKDYPEINFIGLLIGPRGHTLKDMEAKSGAKIAIRGKGSVKEGKGRSDPSVRGNMEEDLHCLVTADSEDKINHAIKLIDNVIQTAASVPEGQNDLKRNQLRQLATLNGTLRDDENQVCQNCGNVGHRRFDCPERINHTMNIVCRHCGSIGHIARDCPVRDQQPPMADSTADREYQSLMQELGGGSAISNGNGEPQKSIEFSESGAASPQAGHPPPWAAASTSVSSSTSSPAPWAKPALSAAPSNPAPWQQPAAPQSAPAPSMNPSSLPPWQQPTQQSAVQPSNLVPSQNAPFIPGTSAPLPPTTFAPPGVPLPPIPGAPGMPNLNMSQPPMVPPGMALPPGMPAPFPGYPAVPAMPGIPGATAPPGAPGSYNTSESSNLNAPPGVSMPNGYSNR